MKPTEHQPYHTEYRCGGCQRAIFTQWQYCPTCGEKVDWDKQVDEHPYDQN